MVGVLLRTEGDTRDPCTQKWPRENQGEDSNSQGEETQNIRTPKFLGLEISASRAVRNKFLPFRPLSLWYSQPFTSASSKFEDSTNHGLKH